MGRPKTPAEKKALSRTRDHVVAAEFRDGFERRWHRKKATAERSFRRRVHTTLREAPPVLAMDEFEDVPVAAIRRERVRKWGVVPLGEWIEGQREQRVRRTAANYFKRPYDSGRDREAFAGVLTAITQGTGTYSQAIARLFDGWLVTDSPMSKYSPRAWLYAFFRDEPAWEGRLRQWIDRTVAST